MKRIYAFTIYGDDFPSDSFTYNIRLMAFLLYDFIYNYYDVSCIPLIINDKIKNNRIHREFLTERYYFDYNEYNDKYINFEPFFIGKRSFALTINDELLSEDALYKLMEEVLFLIRKDYVYKINSIGYESKNLNDERNRKKAVYQLRDDLIGIKNKSSINIRKKMLINPLLKNKIGIFKGN